MASGTCEHGIKVLPTGEWTFFSQLRAAAEGDSAQCSLYLDLNAWECTSKQHFPLFILHILIIRTTTRCTYTHVFFP